MWPLLTLRVVFTEMSIYIQTNFAKVKPSHRFPQIERFENGFEKSSLIWTFFPDFG